MHFPSWLKTAAHLAPMVLTVVDQIERATGRPGIPAQLVPTITSAIQDAQQAGGSGHDKKALVMAVVNDAILALNASRGPGFIPPEVEPTISKGIDTAISVINLVHGKHEDTPHADAVGKAIGETVQPPA